MRIRALQVLALGLALCPLLLSAQPAATPAAPPAQRTPPPPADLTEISSFDVFADGDTVHLLVGQGDKRGGPVKLLYRQSQDGGQQWSEPIQVNSKGETLMAPHPGENAQIAAHGQRVMAVWSEKSAIPGERAGPLLSMLSEDGGKTWRSGGKPAGDETGYHALPELSADRQGFHAVWLHGGARDSGTPQGLHYTHSVDGSAWAAATQIAPATCRCCWNRLVTTADQDVGVLYRAAAPRDMAFVRVGANRRSREANLPGVAVGAFGWEFEGCPHVGGALAADGKKLHALVWTGKDEASTGLYYSSSADGGAEWSEPARLGDAVARDSDIAVAADGRLVALWGAASAGGMHVAQTQSTDQGKTWSEPKVISDDTAMASHPRVLATAKGVTSFWLERRDGKSQLAVNGKTLATL